ncbi:hypothetical protein [uncultured Croceitalea sp.]|uniref:hypothetical protein n=1 Tax=uncultured Croceitalea sp. TaxID=1798908 RepID=UPI00374E5D67
MGQRSLRTKEVKKFVHRSNEEIKTSITGITYKSENSEVEIFEDGTIKFNVTQFEEGYFAWDGCTPKKEILDLLIGTPDGKMDFGTEEPITYYASFVHDILYKYKAEIPLSRKTVDDLFFLILKRSEFKLAGIYHFGVRTFGGILFGAWKTKTKVKNLQISNVSWEKRHCEEMINIGYQIFQTHPFMKSNFQNQ